MDREALAEVIKEVVSDQLETHLASVHEELTDLRTELDGIKSDTNNLGDSVSEELKAIRKELRDGFVGLKSDIGALHNRIDNETFARKHLEQRVRTVLPKLPQESDR